MTSAQTRIPQVPDQTDFLQKWYDFHRGYRIVTKEDGSEERIAVLGEPFADVSPGHLPRTLDELRAGRDRSDADRPQHIDLPHQTAPTGPSLDAELDQMFEDAAAEENRARPPPLSSDQPQDPIRIAGQAIHAAGSRNREYQNRRIAALRRELHRMRNGIERVISGLRDLGEMVPDPTEATARLANLGRTLDDMEATHPAATTEHFSDRPSPAPPVGTVYSDSSLATIQQRLDMAQLHLEHAQRYRDQSSHDVNLAQAALDEARRNRDEASEVLDGADLDLADHRAQISRLRREQRTAENYIRVFGSREDMDAAGSDYVSPIGSMFTRAWERFGIAEEVRREESTLRQALLDEERAPAIQDYPIANTAFENQLEDYYAMLRRQDRIAYDPTADHLANELAVAPQNRLEHLLRNTQEPERSAIIARMRDNGTAQVLEQSFSDGPFDFYRRLGATRSILGPRRLSSLSEDSVDEEDPGALRGLDAEDSGRPEAKEDEDMLLKLDCKICYTQLADTACLPCGHLVMCQWCSDQHSPVMQHDRTRPRIPANCPVCRKRVKQKVRIYRP